MPNAERRVWMQDRRLLDVLDENGDVHSTPRRVDHWAHFATAASRQAFVHDVSREGFGLESAPDAADGRGFQAQVFRTDTVDLDHIHEVVMKLLEIAETHGGYYDGWETAVVKPPSN